MLIVKKVLPAVGFVILSGGLSASGCATTEDVAASGASVESASTVASGTEDPRVTRRLAHMTEDLSLTEEQIALIRPMLERMEAERHEVDGLARDERHAARRAAHEAFRAELEGVLTPEQLEALEVHRPGRGHGGRGERGEPGERTGHGRLGGRRHFGPPDPEHVMARMREDLALTEAQVETLSPIFERMHERHEAMRDLEPEARRAAARAIREEMKTAIDAALTEEQRAKLEERSAHGRRGRPGPRDGLGRGLDRDLGPGL